ncbi:MAG TPA: sulfotransferase [Solimonas sp.]|nr:sulfotransferase [Solimonas sp.]
MADTAPPVWLLGAPFSGTCWLAGLLGSHPQLYATPQLHLGLADDVAGLLDVFFHSQADHGDGLLRTVAELACGGQTDRGVAAARDWLQQRAALSTAALLQELARLAAPRRLVIPEGEAAIRLPELERLIALAPQAAVVQVLRHPLTQGRLMVAWFVERLFVPVDYRDYAQDPPQVEPQAPWLRAQLNLERLSQQQPLLRFSMESLDGGDAAASLSALCASLGVDADVSLDGSRWSFAGPGPDAAPGGLEADVLMDWPAELSDASAPQLEGPLPWRADGGGFDPQVLRLAKQLGY